MGANYVQREFSGNLPKSEVIALFKRAQEQDRYDNGHSYSGGLGMTTGLSFPPNLPVFASVDLATNWLQDTANKWQDALCVRAIGRQFPEIMELPKEVWLIGAWCSS